MRFYEEFGLSRDATPEKIKESYHTLVRLLHPDQHADPAVKQAAELQMRRINQMYAVLSDPERRRRYDAGFSETERLPVIVPPPLPPRRLPLNGLIWGGVAVAVCGFVFWLADRDSGYSSPDPAFVGIAAEQLPDKPAAHHPNPAPKHVDAQPVKEPQKAETPAAKLAGALPATLPTTPPPPLDWFAPARHGVRRRWLLPTPAGRATAATVTPKPMPQPEVLTAAPPAPILALQQPPVARPEPAFAGSWFYPHVRTINKNPALYPPEYIETMITEEHGSVHGRYRARYQVADRAISPDVVFQFDGKLSGPIADLAWTGIGGSHGLIHLKLISDSAMEVQWSASQLGSAMGLASGTAILRRRSE